MHSPSVSKGSFYLLCNHCPHPWALHCSTHGTLSPPGQSVPCYQSIPPALEKILERKKTFTHFSEKNSFKRLLFSALYCMLWDMEEESRNTFNISGNGFLAVPLRIDGDEEWGQIRQRWNSICDINKYYLFQKARYHLSSSFKQAHSHVTSIQAHPQWLKKDNFVQLYLCNLWRKQMPWDAMLCVCAGSFQPPSQRPCPAQQGWQTGCAAEDAVVWCMCWNTGRRKQENTIQAPSFTFQTSPSLWSDFSHAGVLLTLLSNSSVSAG